MTSAMTADALPDRIEAEVRSRILSGELGQGVQVRQDALAAELRVSRIPVREALARLEREGILVLNHHRGFEVRRLTAEEVREVFDLRLVLEPPATAEAAARATRADRREAEEALVLLEAEMERRGSRVPELNLRFHRALIRPCGRPLTLQFLERLLTLVRAQVAALPRAEAVRAEHRELLAAWTAADRGRIVRLATRHIRSSMNQLGL